MEDVIIPQIGDVRKHIAKYPYKEMYSACESCGKTRWVAIRNGMPVYSLCVKCSQLKKYRDNPIYKERAKTNFKHYWSNPDNRFKQKLEQQRICSSPEEIDRRRKRSSMFYSNPEERLKGSLRTKKSWGVKSIREKRLAGLKSVMSTLMYKKNISESSKKMWSNPQKRNNILTAIRSPEVVERARVKAIGQFSDIKQREMARENSKKMWQSPSFREHMSKVLKEYWGKPESRERDRKQAADRLKDPELRDAHRKRMLAYYDKNPQARQRASEKTLAQWNNPEYRELYNSVIKEKRSVTMKGKWANDIYKERTVKAILNGLSKNPNNLECRILSILDNNYHKEWKYVGNGDVIIGGLNPDFININGKKLIIEVFGDYWHSSKNKKLRYVRTENGRIAIFSKYGYRTLVLWENKIKNSSDEQIASDIEVFIGDKS